jgi:hypothetical protein
MMRVSRRNLGRLAVVVAVVAVAVVGTIEVSRLGYPTVPTYPETNAEAGQVEPGNGTEPPRVVLSADAARRIGLRTAPVRTADRAGRTVLVIPYAAVFYDPEGATWAYVAQEPLVFVRQQITVDSITGDDAILSAGPPAPASVVTVGVAQLYGTEVGVEEE